MSSVLHVLTLFLGSMSGQSVKGGHAILSNVCNKIFYCVWPFFSLLLMLLMLQYFQGAGIRTRDSGTIELLVQAPCRFRFRFSLDLVLDESHAQYIK